MTDTEIFQAWANKAHWIDWTRKKDRAPWLADRVKDVCDILADGELLSTSKLVESMFPGLDDYGKAYASNGLSFCRKNKLLDGYWQQADKVGAHTYGHKAIRWKCPPSDGTEGLEDIL